MSTNDYVHGYSGRESDRLLDQANTLAELLHHDTIYPADSQVLEAGCGVGAQTIILAQQSPQAHFTSVDVSPESVETARARVAQQGLTNVTFRTEDIFDLPFDANSFDHIFVCFVLEHLRQPLEALARLKVVVKPGGTLTVIEGDHASAYFYPESPFAQQTIDCLVKIQASMGGNALIGRQLYPLLKRAGFKNIRVTPRQVYADSSRPEWVEGFTKNTFTAMVNGAREQALKQGLLDLETWERGIADLHATAGEDGTFSYTFFKGVAVK
ncbi:MAG: methyltransferase domain-containing protein [Chloroflexi bacterium]|nr:methyltransferase domain-containing protein [Chloroflexota bacterium]